jgi:predicted TIM-barrel fold metal-dependent hydrolase
VIDTCVHHRWTSEAELHPYLDPDWREYVGRPASLPGGKGMRRLAPSFRFSNPAGDDLATAHPPDGGAPGSSVELVAEQLLDRDDVERALLLFDRGRYAASLPNPHLGAAVVAAINDWNIDRWLADERLYGAVLVSGHLPDRAAAEIRRVGTHPKMAAVLFASNALGQLAGHPIYDPIYEAAAELRLPVVLHRGLDALPDVASVPAGGPPATFADYQTIAPWAVINQVVSLIANGTLAKFPDLRVYVVGAGVMWIPGVLRRMELMIRSLRREVPWVTEPPSEYFERQVRVSTYGIERGAPEALARLFEGHPGLRDVLCHGSGYPSWDTNGADDLRELLPTEWHEAVLRGNAEAWFRWVPAPVPA